jgi:tetratricopeptide (TPR) repeat protein
MKVITLIAANLMLFACATTPDNNKKESSGLSPVRKREFARSTGESIVVQAGAKEPLLSKSGAKYWINQSDSTEASSGKVSGMIASGEWQGAITEARKLLELQPGDPGILLALGAAYAVGRNYEMAAYYAGQVLKIEPSNGDAMNLIGLRTMLASANRRSDYDDALTWFRRSIESDGNQYAAGLNMGYLLLDLGDATAALQSFNQVSSRCRKCFDAQYGYGVAAARTGAWGNAKKTFEDLINSEPDRAEAIYQLALVYKNGLNNDKKAIDLLQAIVNDADGRLQHAGDVKRVANITLRRLKASDRSAPPPLETVMPRGGEKPARAR